MLYISYICLLYTASSCISLVVCYKFATHKRDLADSVSGVEEEERMREGERLAAKAHRKY